MKKLIVLFYLFYSSFVYAEIGVVEPPVPSGKMTEVRKGHLVCIGYVPQGFPSYYVLRSSRPDRFFKDISTARHCFLEVKNRVNNQKKYKKLFIPYSHYSTYIDSTDSTILSGEYDRIRCNAQLQLNGDYAFFEFYLPWVSSKEVDTFVHSTPLGACLRLAGKQPSIAPSIDQKMV